MKSSLKLLYLIFGVFCINSLYGQTLDEETGFLYVKAEYLYETGRYDEAISQYNQVITKDPGYKDALIHRGWAKYAMAAYKGAKTDAVESINLKGINAEAAALLGRSFAQMGNEAAAINSLTAAIALDNKNASYYEWRAGVYEGDDQLLKACHDYEAAMNHGSASAEVKARNLCGSKPKPKAEDTEVTSTPNTTTTSDNQNPNELGENEVLSQGTKEPETTQTPNSTQTTNTQTETQTSSEGESVVRVVDDSEPVVVNDNLPKNDDTVNSLKIDEELVVQIYGQELGKRKITEVPSILILADENGKVTINFCVNKEGIVTSAEFNGSMSTIAKKSLVSLALRKAKEFEFAKGKYDSQCGMMVFIIKPS